MKYTIFSIILLLAIFNQAANALSAYNNDKLTLDPVESWQGQSPSSPDVMIGIRYAKNLKVDQIKVNNKLYNGEFNFDGETLKLRRIKNLEQFRDGANFVELIWQNGDSFITVVKGRRV